MTSTAIEDEKFVPRNESSGSSSAAPFVDDPPAPGEDLAPYQRNIISMCAPSLLFTTTRPWSTFVCFVLLLVLLLVGTTWWLLTHCPEYTRSSFDFMSFRAWKGIVDSGTFSCLYYSGNLDKKPDGFPDPVPPSTAPEVLLSNTLRITSSNSTPAYHHRLHFFIHPCIPQDGSDFVQLYRDATGDTGPLARGLFCSGWDPEDPASAFSKRFGSAGNLGPCSNIKAPSDRSKPGTAMHERGLFIVWYAEFLCPTFLSAGLQGLTLTAAGGIFFVLMHFCYRVAVGMGTRFQRGEALLNSDEAKDEFVRSQAILPNTVGNYRAILELQRAVARNTRVLEEMQNGAAAPSHPVASPMYYPESAGADEEPTVRPRTGRGPRRKRTPSPPASPARDRPRLSAGRTEAIIADEDGLQAGYNYGSMGSTSTTSIDGGGHDRSTAGVVGRGSGVEDFSAGGLRSRAVTREEPDGDELRSTEKRGAVRREQGAAAGERF